ncbi:MAG: hypothetical protein ACLTXM_06090, partial [Enterococcus sp.]
IKYNRKSNPKLHSSVIEGDGWAFYNEKNNKNPGFSAKDEQRFIIRDYEELIVYGILIMKTNTFVWKIL